MFSDALEGSCREMVGSARESAPVQSAPKDTRTLRERIVERLDRAKWLESVAGEDYKAAVDGLEKALSRKGVGIIISGDYGCGKSFFVEAIGDYQERINCLIPEEVRFLDADDYPDFVRGLLTKNVFIDDFGAENIVNKYGVKQDLVGEFICRYHLYGKGRLYITTNLHGNEIIDKKGGRVYSRLKDKCVPIKFKGKDKRVWDL